MSRKINSEIRLTSIQTLLLLKPCLGKPSDANAPRALSKELNHSSEQQILQYKNCFKAYFIDDIVLHGVPGSNRNLELLLLLRKDSQDQGTYWVSYLD